MDHPASECVMVGRVGGRVKQMSQAGDEICLLLCFFFFTFVCVFCYFRAKKKKKKSRPRESSRISENPSAATPGGRRPPCRCITPADLCLLLINETLPGWIPPVPRPLAAPPPPLSHPDTTSRPLPPPDNLLRPRRGTAALKSTIRQQSAPTKPAFSPRAVATRCPAGPPGWSWQDGGLRERRGAAD